MIEAYFWLAASAGLFMLSPVLARWIVGGAS